MVDTRFGIASGTKGLTALTVVGRVEAGQRDPGTTARSLLGEDLALIDDEVTGTSWPTVRASATTDVRAGRAVRLQQRRLRRPRADRGARQWHAVPRAGPHSGLRASWHARRLHPTDDAVIPDGSDAGVSFRSINDPATGVMRTVLSDTTSGAWPVARRLAELLDPADAAGGPGS